MKNFMLRDVLREEASGAPDGGTPPAFDPEKFKAELLAETSTKFNAALNAAIKNAKKDWEKSSNKDSNADDKGKDTTHHADGKTDDKADNKVSPEEAALRRDLAAMKTQLAALTSKNEQTEAEKQALKKQTTIDSAVNQIEGWKGKGKNLFIKAISNDLAFDEDGDLVAKVNGESLPAADYIKSQAAEYPEFFESKVSGGSGASAGTRGGKKQITLEDIKPGMSAAALQEAMANLAGITSK